MFLFVYDVAMYYIPYSFLPPVAAVVAFKGFARIPIGDAKIPKNRNCAYAADAGEIFAAAGGAFGVIIKRAQTGPITCFPVTICLLAFSYFFWLN